MFLLVTTTFAATLQVGASQTYTTIEDAVTAASDGDEIQVDAGTYAESITLTKDLSITTSAGATITPPNGKNAFRLDGVDATISGFTIEGSNQSAIWIDGGTVILDGLSVEGGGSTSVFGGGVYITGSAEVDITDLSVSDTEAQKGGAIYIDDGSSVVSTDVTIDTCVATWGGAVRIEDSSLAMDTVTVTDVSADQNGGAFFIDGSTVDFVDLTITNPVGDKTAGVGLYLSDYSSVSISGGEITGAEAANYSLGYDGGAIRATTGSSISVSDFTFEDCIAYRGGAVSLDGGAVGSFDTVSFDNNDATRSGGALDLASGVTVDCTDCTFSSNTAKEGGAVNAESGTTFDDNNGDYDSNVAEVGGAVYLQSGATFMDTNFESNDASSGLGGAIYAYSLSGTVSLDGVYLASNTASDDGGAIAVDNKVTLEITDSNFLYNEAGGNGGAIAFAPDSSSSWDFSVSGSTFEANVAVDDGGAIFVLKGEEITLHDSWFEDNSASNGGAVYLEGSDVSEVVRCDFHNNEASDAGGALFEVDTAEQGSWTNNSITENVATNGGAIYLESTDSLELTNNTFLANDASAAGAHLYAVTGSFELVNNILAYGVDGGGVACDSATASGSDIFYNAVYQNAGGHYTGCSDPTGTSGNFEDDPDLVDYSIDSDASNDDLHLNTTSPCVDTGHPSITDVDSTRSDIGAYGGPDARVVDADEDGWYDTVDCDDNDSSINPGATETPYDGIDQDCDGSDLTDVDGDGFDGGTGTDCDDTDATVYPGATETWYDGVDQDCDGASDFDADTDQYDDQRYGGLDCDDADPAVNPSATEIWYDGVDQDCDAWSDYDADQDGFDSDSWGGTDCDDQYGHINPIAPEVPYTGIDEDCDGVDITDVDGDGWDGMPAGGLDCDDEDPTTFPGATDTPYDGIDQNCDRRPEYDWDGDGYDSHTFGGDDCDDFDVTVHPYAWEVWYDGVDQNCDQLNDFDQDLDGFESEDYGGTDCDDTDATVYPGAYEVWYDGVDQDCRRDDDYDRDGDGWVVEQDCDDFRSEAHPGAEELFNGLDDDCDGWAEDDDRDQDGAIDWDEWTIGSDPEDPDTDNDGLEDGKEIGNAREPRDTDLDAILDVFDEDDDGDGIPSLTENLADPDEDGVADKDLDGDGVLNSRDRDTDGDGFLDKDEGLNDTDWDGVPDYIDYNGSFSGGGCGGDVQWLSLLFLAPLFHRRRRVLGVAAALMVGLSFPLSNQAVAGGVDAHGFQVLGTTGDSTGYTRLAYPSGGHRGDFDSGVLFDYGWRPLVEVLPEGRQPVVSHLTTANVVASGSLGAYTRLEVVLPVHTMGVSPYDNWVALGDMRLGAVVPAFAPAGIRPGVAIAPSVWLPTGAEDRFVGNPGLSAGGVISVAQELGRFGYVANVGARVGKFEPERNLQAGAGPLVGLGAHYRMTNELTLGAEFTAQGNTGFREWPLEVMGTARIQRPGGAWTTVGLGFGLTDDTGSSTVRAVVGGGWQRRTTPPPEVIIQYLGRPVDPSADRDGDGIVDIEDDCPDQPETFDGFTDEDGCPELDGDQDGVEFFRDACPRVPIYPEQDPRYSDGCPKLAELSGDKILTQSIFFREDSAVIVRKSYPVLDDVARIINENPDIDAVLIEGHTNDNGGKEYNYRLSEDRANSVMRYLIDQGVPRDRLVTHGYGFDKPLVPHDDPDAKTVNRRVEFTVVKRVEFPFGGRLPDASELPGSSGSSTAPGASESPDALEATAPSEPSDSPDVPESPDVPDSPEVEVPTPDTPDSEPPEPAAPEADSSQEPEISDASL